MKGKKFEDYSQSIQELIIKAGLQGQGIKAIEALRGEEKKDVRIGHLNKPFLGVGSGGILEKKKSDELVLDRSKCKDDSQPICDVNGNILDDWKLNLTEKEQKQLFALGFPNFEITTNLAVYDGLTFDLSIPVQHAYYKLYRNLEHLIANDPNSMDAIIHDVSFKWVDLALEERTKKERTNNRKDVVRRLLNLDDAEKIVTAKLCHYGNIDIVANFYSMQNIDWIDKFDEMLLSEDWHLLNEVVELSNKEIYLYLFEAVTANVLQISDVSYEVTKGQVLLNPNTVIEYGSAAGKGYYGETYGATWKEAIQRFHTNAGAIVRNGSASYKEYRKKSEEIKSSQDEIIDRVNKVEELDLATININNAKKSQLVEMLKKHKDKMPDDIDIDSLDWNQIRNYARAIQEELNGKEELE